MKYRLIIESKALKSLKNLDKPIAKRISQWIKENLSDCDNPRAFGEPLTGEFKGFWKYRIGDYRVLANIDDAIRIVAVFRIDHRSQVYKK